MILECFHNWRLRESPPELDSVESAGAGLADSTESPDCQSRAIRRAVPGPLGRVFSDTRPKAKRPIQVSRRRQEATEAR